MYVSYKIRPLLINHSQVNEATMFNGNVTIWNTSSAVNMDTMVRFFIETAFLRNISLTGMILSIAFVNNM